MIRKFVAMLLCVMMIASIIAVPAFADETADYADYVPGKKPPNMIKSEGVTEHSAFLESVGTTGNNPDTPEPSMVVREATNGYKGISIMANGTPGGAMTGDIGKWYQINAGLYFEQSIINSNSTSGIEGDLADGKNYVYAVQVRNLNLAYTPNVRFLLYDMDALLPLNAVEWGSTGMPVTSTEWMDFRGSIAAPDVNKEDSADDVDTINIGFNSSTVAGSKIDINFTDDSNGMYPIYFAEEAVYDISNELTSDSRIVTTETPATFEARILNQVGLPGNLNQGTFVWKAMNKERTAEIPGFTITANANAAYVTVDNTVQPGKYDIVAYSTTYDMAKGYTITVDTLSDYLDYIPGEMPSNLIQPKNGTLKDLQNFTTTDGQNAKVKPEYYGYVHNYFSVLPKLQYDGTTTLGKVATYYQPGVWPYTSILPAEKMLQDETYVVRFKARNNGKNPANARVNFAALNYNNDSQLDYTKEYGIDGMELTGSDWQWFKGTLYIKPKTEEKAAARFQIGLSVNALAGTGVDIWHNCSDVNAEDAIYIAYEQAYDITNKIIQGSDTFRAGDSAAFRAQLVNQIGLPGYLEQNFTWKVFDRETRKIELEDVEITTQGNTATLTTTRNTKPGEYVVVAYNEANKMARGIEITVLAEEVTGISVDTSAEGKAALTTLEVANTSAEKIFVAVASYTTVENAKKIVDVAKAILEVADGAAALREPIEIIANAGNEVRVFAWDNKNLRPIAIKNGEVSKYTK